MEQSYDLGVSATVAANDSAATSHDEPSIAGAWYVVGVLTIAYMFSFIDRQILSLLVKPIQSDLNISEKQMSLLMGLSFAVFYTLFGIPLGRLADTKSRRMLILWGIAFWSLMTTACGLTRKYWQLALMRMGVGVGEASLSPSAYSLIADYFRPERRSTAISVYSMGIYVGSGMAFILGGLVVKYTSTHASVFLPLIGETRSWQLVFFIVGAPGLLLAPLMLTIREPVRRGLKVIPGSVVAPLVSTRQVWQYVNDNWATFVCLNLGVGMMSLSGYGAAAWVPAFLDRRYGLAPGQSGLIFGLVVGVFGTLGIVSGGYLADRLRQRGWADANVRVALAGAVIGLPFALLYPLMPTATWAAVFLAPSVFACSVPFGVTPAAFQQMMPNTMRAQATAIYLFVINVMGLGIGPTIVAVLTQDYFHDAKAVSYSLLIVGACSHAVASILLWLGLRPYGGSLRYLMRWGEARTSSSS
jgi:MFS family permease